MTIPVDLVLTHAAELITCADHGPSVIRDGAIAISAGKIALVGNTTEVLAQVRAAEIADCTGQVVTPGFVDCHTHVVFGDSRVDEYVAKTSGTDLDAVRASGAPVGIKGTVAVTRALSVDDLVEQAASRIAEMIAAGTTTLESKTGYGLELATELKLLEVNRRLNERFPVEIVSTFLGAHGVLEGSTREAYIDEIVEQMLPRVAESGLAEFNDVWCDNGLFSIEESRRIIEAGSALGLLPKLHLDQLGHTGGAAMAAETGCVSVDHLNYTTDAELALMAEGGVTAVAMPGIDFATAHNPAVDCRRLLASGMRLALATDICPGGWIPSMQYVIGLGCRLHGLTPLEAITASTLGAAYALNRGDRIGSLKPGKDADVLVLDVPRHEDLAYRLGRNAVRAVYKRGIPI